MSHPDQNFGDIFYSQNGEDIVLLNLFSLLDIKNPSWLDIGAHHPSRISNTKLFYDRGSNGINIEANPNLIAAFLVDRPRDLNLNFGVATENGSKDFFMFDAESGRNTFDKAEADRYSKEYNVAIEKVISVPVATLTAIAKSYFDDHYPDLLSIDTEGSDFDILSSTDFGYNPPKIICVETRRNDNEETEAMLFAKDYWLHSRLGENQIYIYDNYYDRVF